MEAVGARQGRLSSRYGQTTVFTGPVRKWKKKWIHVAPPSSSNSNSGGRRDGGNSGGNGSNVMLFKWAPILEEGNEGGDDLATAGEGDGRERTRKKLKFVPIALLEEQKSEAAEEEPKGTEPDLSKAEEASKGMSADEKPDMNDTPMGDNEEVGTDGEQIELQDLNKTADEGNISQSKTDDEYMDGSAGN